VQLGRNSSVISGSLPVWGASNMRSRGPVPWPAGGFWRRHLPFAAFRSLSSRAGLRPYEPLCTRSWRWRILEMRSSEDGCCWRAAISTAGPARLGKFVLCDSLPGPSRENLVESELFGTSQVALFPACGAGTSTGDFRRSDGLLAPGPRSRSGTFPGRRNQRCCDGADRKRHVALWVGTLAGAASGTCGSWGPPTAVTSTGWSRKGHSATPATTRLAAGARLDPVARRGRKTFPA